ncbi:uncharacterized protein LOC121864729, partial [Homarus americanus]|uniref:uncharacterized protein LOC121864729 n=2 Tax=Homarus americanus TaxID=6706 RepID=UPI001C45BE8F
MSDLPQQQQLHKQENTKDVASLVSKESGLGDTQSDQDSKDIMIDRSTLEEYLKIEREIAEEESNNPIQPLELKTDQMVRLTEEIDRMEEDLQDLERKTEKEKADVDHLASSDNEIKAALLEMETFDDQMAKEKAEYVAALNKQEIAAQELETHKKQREQISQEVAELETRANHLHDLYKRHDSLLDRLFGGEYGSVAELLEAELDELEAHRGRIMEANFKWRQAQMMLEYACKQLAVAVQKWQDLPTIPTIDLEIRYSVAAETRNNLVAAGQNIHGAQRYLDNVNFPYCAPGEVDTLNKHDAHTPGKDTTSRDLDMKKATEYVFTDMQSPERHDHAQSCYSTTHKRANALLQWFDTVINTTIMKDLNDINAKVKGKTLELRRERVRLIQEKVRELWGTDIELDSTLRMQDVDVEQMARGMLTDGQVVKLDGGDLESQRAGTPPLLSEDELAPMPSNNVIFGNMYDHYQNQLNNLAQQHREEMNQFMKEQ